MQARCYLFAPKRAKLFTETNKPTHSCLRPPPFPLATVVICVNYYLIYTICRSHPHHFCLTFLCTQSTTSQGLAPSQQHCKPLIICHDLPPAACIIVLNLNQISSFTAYWKAFEGSSASEQITTAVGQMCISA